ncbi:MAG: phosphatase PAP2 family protein [Hyphomicrobiales bacterium]
MLASALIANGLVVNLMLKEHWGRARPHQTLDFGGEHAFTPAWAMSDACASNCSFVSGEASSAFWLLTAACLVPPLYRVPVGVVLAVLAGTIAFNRVAVGGHYLSDIVLSALITLTVAAALRVLFRPAGSGRDPAIRRLVARLRSDFSAAPGA